MKRMAVGLLCMTLVLGLLTGCAGYGGSREVLASSSSNIGGEPQADQEIENTDDTTAAAKEKQADGTVEKDMSWDLSMTTLKDSAGTIDYTSLEGLNLEKGSHIAVVVKSTKTGYWASVKKGMEAAVKDLNQKLGYKSADKIKLSFEGPSDGTDVETQINIIDAVLSENPDVLCLAAIDMESCQAQLETAEENGIPVIVLDSGVSAGKVNAECSSDNYGIGVTAAQKLSEAIGNAGQVALMTHVESSETSVEREKGFTEELAKNHPQIQIVDVSHEKTGQSMEEMAQVVLKQYPELKGYFCTNETSAADVLSAITKAGNESVKVAGVDTGKKQKEAVKSGTEIGVVSQNPYGMGYATVVAAARAELGLQNDGDINPGYVWIDTTNIDDETYLNYLYE